MRLIRAADHAVSVWKNGGGTTREIAAYPAGASLDDFDWRLSMATVSSDGPFSSFPGIDRILTVISGEMELAAPGHEGVALSPDCEPFAFQGEAPIHARVMAGPVIDLNLMVRRGRFTGLVRRSSIKPGVGERITPSGHSILFCEAGVIEVFSADRVVRLEGHDSMMLEVPPDGPLLLHAKRPSRLLLLEIREEG